MQHVWSLIFQDISFIIRRDPAVPNIFRIAIFFIKRCSEWLILIDLPISYSCSESSSLFIIQRNKLSKWKYFHMIQIPKTESYSFYKSISSEYLQLIIEVVFFSAEFFTSVILFPIYAVTEKILILLCDKPIEKLTSHLIISIIVIRNCFSCNSIQQLLIICNRHISMLVIFLCVFGDFECLRVFMFHYAVSCKLHLIFSFHQVLEGISIIHLLPPALHERVS